MTGLVFTAVLAACSEFPDLSDTVSPELEAAEFPRLVPVEPLLQQADEMQITEATTAELAARVARLRARAARLKRSVVDSGSRARMRDGVAPIQR